MNLPHPPSNSPRVGLVSLGCPKNLVDSEVMAGLLRQAGFQLTGSAQESDIVIVNTCAFIHPAIAEAKVTIREMAALKDRGSCRLLIVTGCLPQREGKALLRQFPQVDALLGAGEFPRIVPLIESFLQAPCDRPPLAVSPRPTYLYDHTTPRLLSTPPWTAYLKLAEGCNHRCSFCTVPSLRGRLRSREPASVLEEATQLARLGVKEINLVAQDTTAFGLDRSRRSELPSLLRGLARIEGIRWVRLLYCFPSGISSELIEAIASGPTICHYLDIPFQHSHREILRAMRRPGNGERYLRLIEKLRRQIPDIALRTSLIVGFPGESEAHFQHLLAFVEAAQLDRVGAFPYWREAGTPAAGLAHQVPPELARERLHQLLTLQRKICRRRNRLWLGRKIEVLVEETRANGTAVGRCWRDAPEIDGVVYLSGSGGAVPPPGSFVRATVTRALSYDLHARCN